MSRSAAVTWHTSAAIPAWANRTRAAALRCVLLGRCWSSQRRRSESRRLQWHCYRASIRQSPTSMPTAFRQRQFHQRELPNMQPDSALRDRARRGSDKSRIGPPMRNRKAKPSEPLATLKGWKAIGDYLGIGPATAQRWAKGGMPVRRERRFTVAEIEAIRQWLGRESHMPAPARIVTSNADIAGALKDSIAALRRKKRGERH